MFKWLRGTSKGNGDALASWRAAWSTAIESTEGDPAELRRQLEAATTVEADVELELEMLDAIEQLRELQRRTSGGELPTIETHHRVVAGDVCHLAAPASLPDDPAQASGRVLLTAGRAVFVGGGRTTATPWHAVHEVVRVERDVLLGRADRSAAAHYRFNTFADAVLVAYLARRLKGRRPGRL